MKKFFETVGLISLIAFTFFYTEKTVNVVRQMDDIMIEINKVAPNYYKDAINAKIIENTIIPGVNGRKVDSDKSYFSIKKYGSFNAGLLEYTSIYPKVSIRNTYNKYVMGANPIKKTVSLIFIVEENDDILPIINILTKNNIKANFFIDGLWLERNNDLLIDTMRDGHDIGNLSYNMDYSNSAYLWMDTIIKKIGNQKSSYCYVTSDIKNVLDTCSIYHNYTIKPSIITKANPALEIKNKLVSGSIISMPVNDVIKDELQTIINIIKSRGLGIVKISEHISENYKY
jgi:hypothetical protein